MISGRVAESGRVGAASRVRYGGFSGFVPTQVSGCVLWLRADNGVVFNGSAVSQWRDLTGNGNDFAQATPANQPLWLPSAGPLNTPTLSFLNASNRYLGAAKTILPRRKWTVFCTLQCLVTGGYYVALDIGLMVRVTQAPGGTAGLRELTLTGVIDETADARTALFECWTLQDDGTNQFLRVNGVNKTLSSNSSTPGVPSANSSVGAATMTGSNWWTGNISEVIAYQAALTAAQVAQVEAYQQAQTALW